MFFREILCSLHILKTSTTNFIYEERYESCI